MVCAARGSTVIKFALVGSHGEPVYATCCSCCDPSNGLKSSSKFKTHTRIYIYMYQSCTVSNRFGSCREGSVSGVSVSFHAPHQSCPTIPFRSVSIASRVHQFRFVPYPLPHRAHEFRFVPFRIWHVSPPFRFVSVRPYHSASDSVSFRSVSKRLYRFIPVRFL